MATPELPRHPAGALSPDHVPPKSELIKRLWFDEIIFDAFGKLTKKSSATDVSDDSVFLAHHYWK